jgi:hypothetical protein
MNDELKPMPMESAVQVIRWEIDKQTGERREVITATASIDVAGKITFNGNAGRAFEPLLRIARRCAARLVEQSLREAMQEAKDLQTDQEL